jgi:hypothetical protein
VSSSAPAESTVRTDADQETGLFVYGVTSAGAELPADLTGVDGAPVRLVGHGPVAAVVGEITLDRPPGRRAELLAYTAVLDTLSASGPVAPVQFGSVLVDDDAVIDDLLAPQAETFAEMLADLEGCRQLNLRATYVEEAVLAEVVSAEPEIRRLRERTRDLPEDAGYADRVRLGELVAGAVERRREADAAELLEQVLPYTVGYAERSGGGLDHVLDVALLVEADSCEALEDHLEGLAEAIHERIRLRLVGPVAPYDFVGAG